MVEEYFRQLAALIAASPIVDSSSITYDKRSSYIGFIRGEVFFCDGSRLHIREFVNVQHGADRYMCAYHYQAADGSLVFRYDNTPHFPSLATYPHHKHDREESKAMAANAPDFESVLKEIQALVVPPTA